MSTEILPPAAPAARPAAGRPQAEPTAHVPPALTLEGWYTQHQLFTIDREALRAMTPAARAAAADAAARAVAAMAEPSEGGWSAAALLVGSTADVMVLHFRPTLDALGAAQRAVLASPLAAVLRPAGAYLGVTEAGMYALTSKLARDTAARGGVEGDAEYVAELERRLAAERESPHLQRRLYPPRPGADMPYVCFYPMSKRRAPEQNWYALSAEERSRLMWEHGKSGRRFAGRLFQVITGSIGFNAWEWGVTLFAGDPLEFKRAVTEMRFDEVSAQYAEFGDFWVGRLLAPTEWTAAVIESAG
ncbi:chlorite dismutase family protein [Roseisolibacter sp. H3M3-2]|uniref:chlorite dismutase family protein n=1 Tax=Roseisolibacter sp. H3M3-2 TaxID=3031323 RepID=UPI0023DA60D7|nr:chlorite dismutase family protein [Roseisolibacter sp. H3M3-2]MDF1501309.1 chlorite dismutase family protein [Roseisolibacter sp. H3M3-2]